MQPITVHHHFRCLRTFFAWCVKSGVLSENPMRGITMRSPKTLPRGPEDDEVRRLIEICGDTWEWNVTKPWWCSWPTQGSASPRRCGFASRTSTSASGRFWSGVARAAKTGRASSVPNCASLTLVAPDSQGHHTRGLPVHRPPGTAFVTQLRVPFASSSERTVKIVLENRACPAPLRGHEHP